MTFAMKSPLEWNCDDVCAWIISLEFETLVAMFRQERITGAFLLHIVQDKDALAELGIVRKLDQRRIEFELTRVLQQWVGMPPPPSSGLQVLASAASATLSTTHHNPSSSSSAIITSTIKPALKKRTLAKPEDATITLPLSLPVQHKKARKSSLGKDPAIVPENQDLAGLTPHSDTMGEDDMLLVDEADHDTTVIFKPALETIPIVSFEVAKSARAKCRCCELQIVKGEVKVGLRSFYFTRELDPLLECKECKNCLISVENPAEQLVTIVGKGKKREVFCMECISTAMQDRNNVGLDAGLIAELPGFAALSQDMQDKARWIFKLNTACIAVAVASSTAVPSSSN